VVGFTTGSRAEEPGKKENLWQEMMIIIIIMHKIRGSWIVATSLFFSLI
jgi:hypothetical protein